jgi:Arc/MetJ-type ribon-helix-helix transcriptional regulator
MATPRSPSRQPRPASVTLKIPRPLYEQLAQVIADSGFRSVTEFVVYVLRDLLAAHHSAHEAELSHEELEIVRRRLKSLGYLES